ncbi:DNA polymerase IV [Thermoclostridium stercorarium subsp. stercorarium DSM 8532]|jgi:DNA polymerase-4|uniref:DNA polymerase IV n=3 Tax=Thermoclostridium stercorarium TaxID=1510 RepID=L7VQJ9_THES1|nr:DNA polymerase IV [Thermoclostridium stercorarium]AGC68661.1 DNA polymerase IV [Thermoclostridium stercorarium subsp. stercorarium DSM 8532]AGI39673.1 nucleotidyltransferase [Thermoclostridium stercorarium subsp. stercorarium DSM 8532]ANW98999.1 DNA polymerase IV [Thermoclostridium stercorarium subsp. thermolacticum DSM 2910]ANX01528.1 DNA polymerase IV [Thermoclostridium stercorarium subsp. leptospartum DSM 9219]UZQ84643.1 DNA polymerase IV [Thermoclostridium stercorarium]
MNRIIMHIDVNNAYLSWEAVYRLQMGEKTDLREIPSVVGGDEQSRHGIVLAKSNPAKKYSIQTGEALYTARKKCPNLVVVPVRYELYMMCHNAMTNILHDFSPNVQVYSIDEAFLDYTGMENIHGDPVEAAYKLKNRIKTELGFTVNVGISSNKLLAKMASELKKPDMVNTLFPDEIKEKMWPLPVRELFMVGPATAPKLYRLNIFTIGDLAQANPELLQYHLKSWGKLIRDYANGIENSPVSADARPPIKGIGNSTTIPFDVDSADEARKVLLSLCEMVGMRLRQAGYCAKLVSVYLRNTNLTGKSHQRKFATATDDTYQIFNRASQLMEEMWTGEALRGMGVHVSDLVPNDLFQISMFEPLNERRRRLDKSIDQIRMKYGPKSVIRSVFVNSGLAPITGGVIEDFKMMSSIL